MRLLALVLLLTVVGLLLLRVVCEHRKFVRTHIRLLCLVRLLEELGLIGVLLRLTCPFVRRAHGDSLVIQIMVHVFVGFVPSNMLVGHSLRVLAAEVPHLPARHCVALLSAYFPMVERLWVGEGKR